MCRGDLCNVMGVTIGPSPCYEPRIIQQMFQGLIDRLLHPSLLCAQQLCYWDPDVSFGWIMASKGLLQQYRKCVTWGRGSVLLPPQSSISGITS
ncbi:hypothetical protein GDO81_011257 [Engystomops pustulosus]|uniref:Uncharacterized protein n=1 Tax=Engystomops pustulosus TaxID=76066 RepID=A0AAV7BCR9_ENGPU|nr:hypothetical protein GDO81_011257 [Engystomops pustulosus]